MGRATTATNALENHADLAETQKWLGHANISTTRQYAGRGSRTENSPTYRVDYFKRAGSMGLGKRVRSEQRAPYSTLSAGLA